jgi:hypothetical protein
MRNMVGWPLTSVEGGVSEQDFQLLHPQQAMTRDDNRCKTRAHKDWTLEYFTTMTIFLRVHTHLKTCQNRMGHL